jgi:hypothetical protein
MFKGKGMEGKKYKKSLFSEGSIREFRYFRSRLIPCGGGLE